MCLPRQINQPGISLGMPTPPPSISTEGTHLLSLPNTSQDSVTLTADISQLPTSAAPVFGYPERKIPSSKRSQTLGPILPSRRRSAEISALSPLPGGWPQLTPEQLRGLLKLVDMVEKDRVLTRSSSLASIIDELKESHEVRNKIHLQMDRIYNHDLMCQYFHAFCIGMANLLEGSHTHIDTNVRPGVSIEMDSKHNFVSSAAAFVAKSLPGLEGVASIVEGIAEMHNKKMFNDVNRDLASLTNLDETTIFIVSIAREMTLAMAGRIQALKEEMENSSGDITPEYMARNIQYLQKKFVDGGAGQNMLETTVIMQAFHHVDKVAAAMIAPEKQTPPFDLPVNASSRERMAAVLEWYCKQSNSKTGRPEMRFDRDEMTWGTAEHYEFRPVSGKPDAHAAQTREQEESLRETIENLRIENSTLRKRLSNQSVTSLSPPSILLPVDASGTHVNLTQLQQQVEALSSHHQHEKLMTTPLPLSTASEIVTTFLAQVESTALGERVKQKKDSLVKGIKFGVGSRDVKKYLEEKFGSTHKKTDTRTYTMRDDVIECAKSWVKTWDDQMREQILEIARSKI